jgi:Double-stranded RNA binding motif
MASPKALLQQYCHKSKPALNAPRMQKSSRAGEPPRYACTIVFPEAKATKSKKKQINGTATTPSGSRTWQVLMLLSCYALLQGFPCSMCLDVPATR